MKYPSWKPAIIGVLLVLTTLVSGCAALRFSYNHAHEFMYWWFDRYVDFTDEQTPQARAALATWFRWNRGNELQDYAALLQRAQSDVQAEETTAAVPCRWYREVVALGLRGYDHGVPALAQLASTLTPQQVAHIGKRYDKVNEKFRDEHLQDDPEERRAAEVKRVVKHAESLYGSLSRMQRQLVEEAVGASPQDARLLYQERLQRQQEVITAVRALTAEPVPPQKAHQMLRALARHAESSPRPAYRAYQQRLVQYNCEFAARLHNSTSAEQRHTAVKRLKGWEADLRALAAQAAL